MSEHQLTREQRLEAALRWALCAYSAQRRMAAPDDRLLRLDAMHSSKSHEEIIAIARDALAA